MGRMECAAPEWPCAFLCSLPRRQRARRRWLRPRGCPSSSSIGLVVFLPWLLLSEGEPLETPEVAMLLEHSGVVAAMQFAGVAGCVHPADHFPGIVAGGCYLGCVVSAELRGGGRFQFAADEFFGEHPGADSVVRSCGPDSFVVRREEQDDQDQRADGAADNAKEARAAVLILRCVAVEKAQLSEGPGSMTPVGCRKFLCSAALSCSVCINGFLQGWYLRPVFR